MEFKLTNKTKAILAVVAGVLTLALIIGGAVGIANAAKKNKQDKCEHEYNAGTVLYEATCTKQGVTLYTCTLCEKELMEDIPANGHTETKIPAVAATCTATGLTDGVKCAACDTVLVAPTKVPILGHNIVLDKAVEATCTVSGLTEGSHCQRCKETVKKQEVVPASGHQVVVVEGTGATCTSTGKTSGSKCSRCNTVFSAQEIIPVLGHDLTEFEAKAASCVEHGWNAYAVCNRDGCKYSTYKEIAAFGHNFDNGICQNCGFTFGDDHEHIYEYEGEVIQPTCTQAGKKVMTCECGEKQETSIPATGHTYSGRVTTAATCETDGVKTYTCLNCEHSYKETVLALGHDYDARVTTPVTCEVNGVRTNYCTICTYYYTEEIPAIGHDYGTWQTTKQATCEENGMKTKTCANCGGIETQTIMAYGHSYDNGVITKNATCEADGVKTFTCGSCGDTYTSVVAKVGHYYNAGKVTAEATCTTAGVKTYVCQRCNKEKTEDIPAMGHTYVNGACETCGQALLNENLKMSYALPSNMDITGTRPKVRFNCFIRKTAVNDITSDPTKELGMIIVSEDAITAFGGTTDTDWYYALTEAGVPFTYLEGTMDTNTLGSYNNTFYATKSMAFKELNTKYFAIPCIKTITGDRASYEYADILTPGNSYTSYPNYSSSTTSLIHSLLNQHMYKGETELTSTEVTNAKKFLNEAIDLANGRTSSDGVDAKLKVSMVTSVSFAAGSSKTVTISISPIALSKFGMDWDDVLVKTELVSGKVCSKDLDEYGNLKLSATEKGTTNVYVYLWGVKYGPIVTTVTA